MAVTRGEVAAQVTQHPHTDLSNSQADSARFDPVTAPAHGYWRLQGERRRRERQRTR